MLLRPFWNPRHDTVLICLIIACLASCALGRIIILDRVERSPLASIYSPTMSFRPSAANAVEIGVREYILETDYESDPTSKLNLYRDRIVITSKAADFISPAAVRFLDQVSKVATALVIPYGDYDFGLGFLEYALSRSALSTGDHCPFFTISVPSLNQIQQLSVNGTGIAQLDSTNGMSPVREIFTSGWFFFITVAEAATSCAVAVVAVIRLWQFRQGLGSFQPTIATVCLWLEMISSMLRFIYWGLDPFGSRRIIPETIKHMPLRTLNFPFTISSTVLLSFYWHETLSATSLAVKMNVSSLRVPAYFTCALAFIVEMIFIGLFSIAEIPVPLVVTFINLGYYVLVVILMAGFYIITASRIFIALYKRYVSSINSSASGMSSSEHHPPPDKLSSSEKAVRGKLFDVTVKLSVSAACLVLILVLAITTFFPFYLTPNAHPGYFAFWFVLTVVLNIKSLSTILSFQPPRAVTRTSTVSNRGPSGKLPAKSSSSSSSGNLHLSQFDSVDHDASKGRTSVVCEPAQSVADLTIE